MALFLDIDAHGRLLPDGDEARRTLADRAGRFLLLPSAPDLLLARRTPAAGGAAPAQRAILAGDLASFPIADFVAFVHQSRLSGLLTVSAGGADRSVAFREGEVRGAQSDLPGERIGEVATRLGYVTAEQLAEAEGGGRPFGKILVARGFLSPADLWKCFHEQVAAVFHGILLAREGVFALVEGGEVDQPGMPLSVNTQSLLMDGIRRIDEMSLFGARIPGPEAFLRHHLPKVPIALEPLEEKLLDLVDGRRRVSDVASAAHLSVFDATKILYHLAEAGYVEATAAPVPEGGRSAEERLRAVADEMTAILRTIAGAVAAAGGLDVFLAGARTFLADPAGRFAPAWKLMPVLPDGGIDADVVLGNVAAMTRSTLSRLEPSGDPVRLVFEALRELVLFYLFQAGERLPPATDEALGREVKRRFEVLGDLR